jgi:predicted HTH transcriptional regulator
MTVHELETIQQSGEGYMVEFKRNVNSDLAKELVAFANAAGGRIFIGIEDDGSIIGCSFNNEINARVQMMARDCDPAISIELEFLNNVIIVHVPEGKEKPYPSMIDVTDIATELSTTDRTIRNDLEFLTQKGWIISSGSTRGRDYELTELAKLKMSKYV